LDMLLSTLRCTVARIYIKIVHETKLLRLKVELFSERRYHVTRL
jgi:hypothetical protein